VPQPASVNVSRAAPAAMRARFRMSVISMIVAPRPAF
jgi:hypothetical protein